MKDSRFVAMVLLNQMSLKSCFKNKDTFKDSAWSAEVCNHVDYTVIHYAYTVTL